jgi:hypothetical protein
MFFNAPVILSEKWTYWALAGAFAADPFLATGVLTTAGLTGFFATALGCGGIGFSFFKFSTDDKSYNK